MRHRLKDNLKGAVLLLAVMFATASNASDPDINIEGLTDELLDNVLVYLSLSAESCQSEGWRIKNVFAKSDKEISNALRALGYYQPEINKQLLFEDDCWQADFTIAAGEPVRVNQLLVKVQGEAEDDPAFQHLIATLAIKQGDILNHSHYEQIKQKLHSLALERGYLDNQLVSKKLQVYPEKNQANIEIVMDSGVRHLFGEVQMEQDILNPEIVKKYIQFQKGDYYSSKELAKTYNALSSSPYFSHVELMPQVSMGEDNRVPIQIKASASKQHNFSVGVGYDTDIGPLGSLGYENRRLNREGHFLSLQTEFSPILSTAEALYTIPFTQPMTDHVSFGLGYKYEQPDSFESEAAIFSFQYQHLYKNDWIQVAFLDISREKFTISDVTQTTKLLVPGIRLRYTQRDDVLRPSKGYHINLSLAATPANIFSDVTFMQATASAKIITPLPWFARLIARTNLGATLTNDFHRLPASYRFYAGGTETIRGYGYKEVGPKDDKGNVVGGEMLTVVSAEYEQFINKSWGIAAFVDSGNAFNSHDFTIKTGAGMGIRWISPIGPIRLDVGFPLNDADSSFQIHFAAGSLL